MTWETFQNAPIVEAVLDLRVRLPEDARVEALSGILSSHDGYPRSEPLSWSKVGVQFARGLVSTNHEQHVTGTRYLSEDKSRVVQARLDGFTVNHLKPYETWDALLGEAQLWWPRYVEVAHPLEITRVALRYINRILIPKNAKPSDYFHLEPRLGRDLPQVLSRFNMQLGFEDPQRRGTVLINYAMQPAEGDEVPVVLDIDVFRPTRCATGSEEPWRALHEMRDLKNEIFFAAITEKAKENFR